MSNIKQVPAVLLLEDGAVFYGKSAGKIGTTTGEICFNTGMTGYQEIFTDPSYYGQMLVTTNAHIGNYGTKQADTESDNIKIAGLVCKNFTNEYSRQMADHSIQDYFERENLVAISDVDTRELVRYIRDKGAMNAIVSSETTNIEALKKQLAEVPPMEGLELASKVTTASAYSLGDPHASYRVAVLDFGTKQNILRCFTERDCYIRVFPAKTDFETLKDWNPDGYFLSNGPGDPAAMDYAVETVKQILKENKPLFGICLGHQLLALAMDIPTYKMHNGHRGINHPVKNLITGQCEITSQNHGFGVSPKAIEDNKDKLEITHKNLNDETIEGIRTKNGQAFSVQYHPEAAPGPHDSRYLFDEFVNLIKKNRPESEDFPIPQNHQVWVSNYCTDVLNELITGLRDAEQNLKVSLMYPVEKKQLGAAAAHLSNFAAQHAYTLDKNSLKTLLVLLVENGAKETRFLQLIIHPHDSENKHVAIAAFTGNHIERQGEVLETLDLPPHLIPTENNASFNKPGIRKYLEQVWELARIH